jgi:hypothetical protein
LFEQGVFFLFPCLFTIVVLSYFSHANVAALYSRPMRSNVGYPTQRRIS